MDSGKEDRLDLTSEPIPPESASQPASPPSAVPERKTVRVYFGCCRVSAQVSMPARVASGQAKSWRIHCARCGRLTEIPV